MDNKSKLIVLDRDGVINEDSDNYVKSEDEWRPIESSIQAIAQLSKQGIQIAVATNQSGVARGYFDLDTLNKMHTKMNRLVTEQGGHISYIAFCPHGPDDHCSCRKPKPGLLDQIQQHLAINLAGQIMVGDSARDLEAGAERNMRLVLVKTGKGLRTLEKWAAAPPTFNYEVFDDLASFVIQELG